MERLRHIKDGPIPCRRYTSGQSFKTGRVIPIPLLGALLGPLIFVLAHYTKHCSSMNIKILESTFCYQVDSRT